MTPPTTNSSPAAQSIAIHKPLPLGVALIEPRIPQNAGNIARLCVCAGASLYFVGDLGFRTDDKYWHRAGMDYLDQITIPHVQDFNVLLSEEQSSTSQPWIPYFIETNGRKAYTDVDFPENALLVFGNETLGLPHWVAERYPEQCLRIPMQSGVRSLNLSNSVSIVLYEVIRQYQGLFPEYFDQSDAGS